MRRAVLTLVATVAGLVLLLGYKTNGAPRTLRPVALAPTTPTPAGPSPAPSTSPSGQGQSTGTRTVAGQTIDTQYGPVQVKVTFTNGRITDVQPMQLPNSRGRDIEIDNFAVPQLIQETLAAQSAHIDIVSGATYTSNGYAQSLQSALDQLQG